MENVESKLITAHTSQSHPEKGLLKVAKHVAQLS